MEIPEITVCEGSLTAALAVNAQIPEFGLDAEYDVEERLLAKGIDGKNPYFIVGNVDDTPASYAIAYDKPESMHIWLAGTNPQFRGHGLLGAMIANISAEAATRGHDSLTVKSYPRFKVMIRQLGKLGFEREDTKSTEDGAVRFTKSL